MKNEWTALWAIKKEIYDYYSVITALPATIPTVLYTHDPRGYKKIIFSPFLLWHANLF